MLVLSQDVEQIYAAELLAGGAGGVGYLPEDRVGRVDEFVVTERSVSEHIGAVSVELELPPTASGHRRVLAVLAHPNS
ncbi:hypothetical protein [Actinomadura mexicana]|uniref:Uncharacterized protein n=1 Tax=Actinomadura mexicana TaxID=134959 RepID=A0A239FKX6_9ACTN|nr:hypothetical protein [Actinomadura mexicana]SNS57556.1 hypothetical protein SAMN06265355_12132 [Actinomadura mexicana]